MLALLAQDFDEIHLTKYTLGQRAMEPEEVKKHLPLAVGAEGDPHVTIHNSPSDALDRVLPELDKDSGLCVAGSIFLLGEVRDRLITWAEKLD
jgi:folylpolyglutamate synthase/dihydropteroate synthase